MHRNALTDPKLKPVYFSKTLVLYGYSKEPNECTNQLSVSRSLNIGVPLPAQKVEQKSSIVRWNGKYHWNSESKFRSSLISQIVNLKAKTITQTGHSHGEGFLWNHMTAVCYHDGPLSASHSRSITLVTYRHLLSFDCLQFVADNG